MNKDKNIQIGFTFDGKKNTITIKESVLDLYATALHRGTYKEHKRRINANIKNLVGHAEKAKGLSGMMSKFLLDVVKEKIEQDRRIAENDD